jgi:amylosucrase
MTDVQYEAESYLLRLDERFAGQAPPEDWTAFKRRLETHFPQLFRLLAYLYGSRDDFSYHLDTLLLAAAESWRARPTELRALDREREAHPDWFQSQEMLGGVIYVDLFAGTLEGLRQKIPYFRELGLTYLHLMPLYAVPRERNDGGYAVSSYREVNPALGTMEDLRSLATDLRRSGISLVLDFVFNHTSDEHRWARAAMEGDGEYQRFYHTFPDRTVPDQYQQTLRDVFPEERPGSFTYSPEMGRWVWTTFHSFQWDLNYSNPAVFVAMAEEMLFLANVGAEVLRLDALAFIWKTLGTSCEGRPEAHMVIEAFNALVRIAAPSLLFKAEAIVHPDEVITYVAESQCQLSYNPLLMALLWESLATREVRLLQRSLELGFQLGSCCAWVNYVRSHDDIGWTFSDEVAADLGINAYDHRQFLNAFYAGRFPGSFARGLPFQENPRTGDLRISGTLASLAGLEKAIKEGNEREIELSIRRILLLHSIILSIGGIPLIFLGDELGLLNDYSYLENPARTADSRWVHRPVRDWDRALRRVDPESIEGRIYGELLHLVGIRRQTVAFALNDTEIIDTGNGHVLGYLRRYQGEQVLVLATFSEHEQAVPGEVVRRYGTSFHDLVRRVNVPTDELRLSPYGFLWLRAGTS